jgi:hypothetical protein
MLRIAQYVKTFILQAWIEGDSREEISHKAGVSTGTVSNVIAEWKSMIGSYEANTMRIGSWYEKGRYYATRLP